MRYLVSILLEHDMTITYIPTNTRMLFDMVYDFLQAGNNTGGNIKDIIDHIHSTPGAGFTGIYIPELEGFLSFNAETIYQPSMLGCESVAKSGLVKGTKNYIIKLNGCPKPFIA